MNNNISIVVINSTGPMASTVVGAIIEKFGYLNIPLRKIGLHDYLIGNRNLNDPFVWNRFNEIASSHGRMISSGGVSVIDRNSASQRILVDKEGISKDVSSLDKCKYKKISEIYNDIRGIYARNVLYKKNTYNVHKHVEYTTDIEKYNSKDLYQAYKSEFEHVYMIHLHRNFDDWLGSLASQRFVHPRFRTKYLFSLSSAYKQFTRYEEKIKQYPGLHIDFSSLFLPNTSYAIKAISGYIKDPMPEIDWHREEYDLYGKLSDYDTTFIQSDSPCKYLSVATQNVIRFLIKINKINGFTDIFVATMYLIDLFIFNRSKSV